MGRIRWGAPFSLRKKVCKKPEKNEIYHLTYTAVYAIIHSVKGRYKK
nr:MAG TPA: hypothetical protein [Caudoviricetes sp.]